MMNLLIIVGVFITPYTQAILNSDPDRIGALKNSVQFMFWNSKDYKNQGAFRTTWNTQDENLVRGWDSDSQKFAPDASTTVFDPEKPTIIVAHGLGGCCSDQQFLPSYRDAGKDFNVIGIRWNLTPKQLDWTNNWFDALEAAGEYSALFVKYMTENYGLNTADVHAVAFSYGTNVIGQMGKYLTKFGLEQIPRCTLLDPVCEGWHPKCGNLEAKGNYGYVDVIHTTAGTLGMLEPIGDIDFYPDGGTIQKCTCASPCEGVNCNKNGGQKNSHARAQSLYEESILSEPDNFLAWKCDDLDLSKNNKYRSCSYDGGDLVPMGEQLTTKGNPTGIYYLHTTGTDGNYSCNDQNSCFA